MYFLNLGAKGLKAAMRRFRPVNHLIRRRVFLLIRLRPACKLLSAHAHSTFPASIPILAFFQIQIYWPKLSVSMTAATTIELGHSKISCFAGVSQIRYSPLPSTSANKVSHCCWPIAMICSNLPNNCLWFSGIAVAVHRSLSVNCTGTSVISRFVLVHRARDTC